MNPLFNQVFVINPKSILSLDYIVENTAQYFLNDMIKNLKEKYLINVNIFLITYFHFDTSELNITIIIIYWC